eukprot:g73844.t1
MTLNDVLKTLSLALIAYQWLWYCFLLSDSEPPIPGNFTEPRIIPKAVLRLLLQAAAVILFLLILILQ